MSQTVVISLFPLTTEEILPYLNRNNIGVNDYFKEQIHSPLYNPIDTYGKETVKILTLREMGITQPVCHGEIGKYAEKLGLTPLPPSIALYLRMAMPKQKESNNSVLSCQKSPDGAVQIYGSRIRNGERLICEPYLRNIDGKLWLRTACFDEAYLFPTDALFAFRCNGQAE